MEEYHETEEYVSKKEYEKVVRENEQLMKLLKEIKENISSKS